jgi:hypothetical protein
VAFRNGIDVSMGGVGDALVDALTESDIGR